MPEQHPFALRYHEVERVDWESCAEVLDDDARRRSLDRGWCERPTAARGSAPGRAAQENS